MEVFPNAANGFPGSSYSIHPAFLSVSSSVAPNSGFASTSVLPASTSTFPAPSASLTETSSASFSELPKNEPTPLRLCSLSEWSQHHIRAIFEAETDDDALHAIKNTFSDQVTASVNGIPLAREGIDALVLSMRNDGRGHPNNGDYKERSGLRVTWQYCVDVPCDSSNREGSFGGVYVIKGIKRIISGSQKPVEFERHKTVTVKIDSISSDPTVDSRRITNLVFVASDQKADMAAVP